ncbi:hypothetical protein [Ketobacter alkanivorans]|uniref:DUF4136 domain-containing protein n=1 Tax=Ketobacter alkanivorans TaxID=1917421 RepID=A0A2K9LJN7_9GAMM|nr:hypothetical protein [Ketobacter alkanivorans]AUM12473.1 hypothetical protein Kalk_08590 [Ketobacter alkanivorans]
MSKVTHKILLGALVVTLLACRSTSIKHYTDADYKTYQIHKFLVESNSDKFEEMLSHKIKQTNAELVERYSIMPPTRSYSPEQIQTIIATNNIDSVLVVQIGEMKKETQVVGTNTQTQHSFYYSPPPNNPYLVSPTSSTITGTSNSTTTTIIASRSASNATATLYDVKTGRIIWTGEIATKAQGTIYTNEASAASDIAIKVLNALLESGHISRK